MTRFLPKGPLYTCSACERLHTAGEQAPCPTCGGQQSHRSNPYQAQRWISGRDYASEDAEISQAQRAAFHEAAMIATKHGIAAADHGDSDIVSVINAITNELTYKYTHD